MKPSVKGLVYTIVILTNGLALCTAPVFGQTKIPVREVLAPDKISDVNFSIMFGVRQVGHGSVLVNDGRSRQLVLLDSLLSHPKIVLDSVATFGQPSYGPTATPIVAYLGDSTLFVEGSSNALLLIDGNGNIVRSIAPPIRDGTRYLASSSSVVDNTGRLIFRMGADDPPKRVVNVNGDGITSINAIADSAPIVRASFESRSVDTIGRVKQQSGSTTRLTRSEREGISLRASLNLLETIDEWTALADGSVAFVRGSDYHIDWIRANGVRESTSKLPFDWRPFSDSEKQHLIDSVRSVIDSVSAVAEKTGGAEAVQGAQLLFLQSLMSLGPGSPLGGRQSKPVQRNAGPDGKLIIDFVPLSAMPDYYPPIRAGAVKGDYANNLWILPATSSLSKAGELVYDVVNTKGELFQRVRLPLGRSIVGFGPAGIIYMMHKDRSGRWYLERTKLSQVSK